MLIVERFMYKWYFPSTDGGQANGINHAGIETFSGSPLKSLAREICQNSLDAILDDSKPCFVDFSFFKIPTKNIPGYQDICTTISNIDEFWKAAKNTKITTFVHSAKKVLKHETILIARISDSNTTGLSGANTKDYRTKWANLVLAAGVSNKSDDAGGSFGIGKSAPFACSDLHIVFYSSLDEAGIEASQGVMNVASFTEAGNNDIKQGLGFFGSGKNDPMFTLFSLDPNYQRSTTGTDIFILGFKDNQDGDEERNAEIIASVIDSFFYAIWKQKLVVQVDDIKIDHESLVRLSQKYKEKLGDFAYEFVPILYEENVREFRNEDFMNMGPLRLLVKEQKGYHRKVARIRNNGMKIDLFSPRVNIGKEFAGILITEGRKINNFLRNIEGPQHTKWEPDRSPNVKYARNVVVKINAFITECIKQLNILDETEILEVDLGDILPDLLADDIRKAEKERTSEAVTDSIVSIGKKRLEITKIKKSSLGVEQGTNQQPDSAGEIGAGSGSLHTGDTPVNPGERQPLGGIDSGEEPIRKKDVQIPILAARVISPDARNGLYYFSFTSAKNAENVTIKVYESTETNSVPADILSAKCNGNELVVDVNKGIQLPSIQAGVPVTLQVKIDIDDYCAMELKINGQLT